MGMLKRLATAALALAMVFSLSACSGLDLDAESLMEAPSLTAEQAKLKEAISLVAGDGYSPKFPSNGEYSSAFMFYDIDGDGADEALAFYSVQDGSVKANILRFDGTDWRSQYEIPGAGNDVECVYFADVGDGFVSIVIKWESEIGIYHIDGNALDTVYSASCDGVVIYDMDRDGNDDIVMFSGSIFLRPNVRIMYSRDGKLMDPETVYINSRYSEIFSMEFGPMGNGQYGLFLEAEIHEGTYITEIITFDGTTADCYTVTRNVEYDEAGDEESAKVTLEMNESRGYYARTSPYVSCDIDGDGIVEIPVEIRRPGDVSVENGFYYLDYMRYDGTELSTVWHGFESAEDAFRISLPARWDEDITASKSSNENEYVFEKYDGTEIMRIKVMKSTEYRDIYDNTYSSLGKSMGTEYFLKITDEHGLSEFSDGIGMAERFEIIQKGVIE